MAAIFLVHDRQYFLLQIYEKLNLKPNILFIDVLDFRPVKLLVHSVVGKKKKKRLH